EDEWGTMNLIVPGAVYERYRALARAEPLLLAHGRLERSRAVRGVRSEGMGEEEQALPVVNVLVRELAALERFLAPAEEDAAQAGASGRVTHLRGAAMEWEGTGGAEADEDQEGAAMGAGMRAVAPPVQSFASGRRR
ncbi:MAG TPA: hypothetical protein VIJ33_08080, partial [Solirubrobacteraceae bacterium]